MLNIANFNIRSICSQHTGDLGNIEVDKSGRAQFRFTDSVLKVWDVIGRTVVVSENADDLGKGGDQQSRVDGNSGKR
jgi:copper chaperone for superoxide dismutase